MTASEKHEKLHDTELESAYWQRFYQANVFNDNSTFCDFVSKLPDLPDSVVDIGCGQGRDAISLARTGRTVCGLDRSSQGIEQATLRASGLGESVKIRFIECDVTDRAKVLSAIESSRTGSNDGRVLFYLRFFLHSISEQIQEELLRLLSDASMPGDIFAAEFRTDKDKGKAKVFGTSHYRRYQSAAVFSQKLTTDYGWRKILHEIESSGLSVFGDEDPVLYRVIALR